MLILLLPPTEVVRGRKKSGMSRVHPFLVSSLSCLHLLLIPRCSMTRVAGLSLSRTVRWGSCWNVGCMRAWKRARFAVPRPGPIRESLIKFTQNSTRCMHSQIWNWDMISHNKWPSKQLIKKNQEHCISWELVELGTYSWRTISSATKQKSSRMYQFLKYSYFFIVHPHFHMMEGLSSIH
jgi:hypothetical protein